MRKLKMKISNDVPKVSQLGRCGTLSDSAKAVRVCVLYHSAICLSNILTIPTKGEKPVSRVISSMP